MPRLLNINTYHYPRGGSDVVYFKHAELFEKMGWANGFYAMHHPKNFESPWSRYFIDEIEFGHRYSLGQRIVKGAKVIYSFEAQTKLKRLLLDFPADIAHLHCIYHHLTPSILPVLRQAGVPIVMTAHDLKVACPAYKMLNSGGICERCKDGSVLNVLRHRCIRDSFAASAVVTLESALQRAMDTYRRYLDRVIVPSRFYRNKLVEWGWPEAKLAYVPNYVDVSKFRPADTAGDYFLYFGRLAPEKGLVTLLRAAARAGVRLQIAGTGPEGSQLKQLATDLNADVNFLGFVSGEPLHELIRHSKAVVLPSEWYENAPMSILESFALGKPVIGARIGGIPEMIHDSETGWIFDSGNADELAACLSRVQSTGTTHLVKLGTAARQFVGEHFSESTYVSGVLSIYSDLGVAST